MAGECEHPSVGACGEDPAVGLKSDALGPGEPPGDAEGPEPTVQIAVGLIPDNGEAPEASGEVDAADHDLSVGLQDDILSGGEIPGAGRWSCHTTGPECCVEASIRPETGDPQLVSDRPRRNEHAVRLEREARGSGRKGARCRGPDARSVRAERAIERPIEPVAGESHHGVGRNRAQARGHDLAVGLEDEGIGVGLVADLRADDAVGPETRVQDAEWIEARQDEAVGSGQGNNRPYPAATMSPSGCTASPSTVPSGPDATPFAPKSLSGLPSGRKRASVKVKSLRNRRPRSCRRPGARLRKRCLPARRRCRRSRSSRRGSRQGDSERASCSRRSREARLSHPALDGRPTVARIEVSQARRQTASARAAQPTSWSDLL